MACAVAAGILLATVHPKPRIVAAIRAATGREVTLSGPIRFGLFPPSVTLHDVALANPPGFATPRMATLRSVTLRVDLAALLHRRLVVRRLVLDAPDVTLERDAAGAANWSFAPPPAREAASTSTSRSVKPTPRFEVLNALVRDATVTYRDDGGGRAFAMSIPRLTLNAVAPNARLHLAGDIVLDGTSVVLTADTGAPANPFPIQLQAQAEGVRLSATATVEASVLRLRDLRLASPAGDLAGTADIAFAPRPTVRAELSGTRLDLAALHRQPPPPPPSPAPVPPVPLAAPTAEAGHLIPDAPLPFAALRTADADIRLTLGEAAAGGQSVRDVVAHATLAGALLSLTAHATFGAAPIDLTAIADDRPATPTLAFALNAPSMPVATLLASLGQAAIATGTMAIAANLHGAGASPHLIAATLDGFAAASMSGGRVQTKALERALGPAIARVNPLGALGGAESDLRCLAVRATASHGMARLAPLLLSSALLTIDGSGQLDLAAETVDLHLQPQGRAGGVAFSVPMTVRGGWRDPHVAVSDADAATTGVRAALALLAGKGKGEKAPPGPSCAEALAAARS